MFKDERLLGNCKKLIESDLDWGDSCNWSNDDFQNLSNLIFQKTKVLLSVSTLKRIWGKVQYESKPSNNTLNTLALFIDYQSWRDYRQSYISENLKNSPSSIDKNDLKKVQFLTAQKITFLIAVIFVGIICYRTYSVLRKFKLDELNSSVRFQSKVLTDDLPNSVIFDYDASAFHSDSVYIQQSWDPARRQRVPGNGKIFTSIYYRPGYFIAKLLINGEIKKESAVFVKSRGWSAMINKLPLPIYLSKAEIHQKDGMGVSDSLIVSKIGRIISNESVVNFSNVREFPGIKAENFDVETVLKNTSDNSQSLCLLTNFVILGTGMAIVIPLAKKGCVSNIGLLTGENWVDGKENDLSAFGVDFNNFQKLKCSVHNKILTVTLNHKEIYHTKQNHSIGRIIGIRYEFVSSGVIKYIKLSSPGVSTYEEKF